MGWEGWKGEELKETMIRASRRAVVKTAEVILEAAKQEVPLDEGTLMRSGIVINPGDMPIAIISFGGGTGTGKPKVPYARRWHEQSANFQRGRKSRYLADPYNKLVDPTLTAALKQEIGEALGVGGV